MASIEKYTDNAVTYELKHNTREHSHPPKNIDIDADRSSQNYFLTPESHGRTARESKTYYNQRLKEVYKYNRADVKTACQWVITAPADLNPKDQQRFFEETYNFLNSLYGEKNCIQCVVHCDEGVKNKAGEIIAGRNHLHYMFLPVVKNNKFMKVNKNGNLTAASKFEEKVCADDIIKPKHLQSFHPNFQKWLDDKGIKCTVYSGITGGKNKSVSELKELTRAKEHIKELEAENKQLKEKVKDLENKLTKNHVNSNEQWGSFNWGEENKITW